MAKGHSSFNKFSPQSGSLDHSPVTGTIVSPPPRASGFQSELVMEAFSDPSFLLQVRGLEAMLRVRERAVAHPVTGRAAVEYDSNDLLSESSGAGGHEVASSSVAGGSGIATNKRDLEMDTGLETAVQRAFVDPEAVREDISRACHEKSRILKSRSGCLDSSFSVNVSSHARARASSTVSCLARPVGASAAVAAVASPVVSRVRSYAQVAAAACDDAVALHDSSLCVRNSGGTGGLLPVQRSTSYCLDNSRFGNNSRRKVRQSSTVGSRSVVQTVDMSPAPAAGTYRRSADTVHVQRQVPRKRLAESSGYILVLVLVVGLVVVEESQASLRPAWRFLAHW